MRFVRVTDDLWAQLATQLPEIRPNDGSPSLQDFARTTLVMVQERFAHEWEALPKLVPGRDEYRVLHGFGPYDLMWVVEGQLARDGHIDLISVSVEPYRRDGEGEV